MSITRPTTPPPVYDSQSMPSSLKPYLVLPHLLSLTWLAYPVLSLLFVAFRLLLSTSSSQDAAINAKNDLLASCKAAEHAATAAASMPRYMAIASNQQFADAVNGTLNGARAALVLTLTVMEVIINFIVDLYRSTFLCFLELVVRGGLSILISAVQELNTFVQNTTGAIRTSIQSDVAAANSVIQGAVAAFNKVNPFGDITVPQFDIPSLSALQNVTLPTDFEDSLVKLNSSLPTLSDLKDKVNALIDTPFELLKKDINDTFLGITFDASVLPVPVQNNLQFCDQLDTSVIDDLGRDIVKATKIGFVILVLLALLLIAGNCLLEWYKWICLKRHLEWTRQAWMNDPTIVHSGPQPQITLTDHNLLMLQANMSSPLLARITNAVSGWLRMSPSKQTNLQWFLHYIFHAPALVCFLIGFFGILSVQLQLLAMGPLEAKFSAKAASSVADFSTTIATSVNNSMYNQSATYANDINGRVDAIQLTINNGIFGWVNGTTTTLNDTLVAFYADVQGAVSTVFSGTILEAPAQEFIKCIIGSKVDALESALTFLNENLRVDMPRVNESVLVLSQSSVNEVTTPIATAAVGGGSDDKQGLVGRLVNNYVESLKKERIMFAIFLGLWGFVVLMALCIIFWHSYGQFWVQAYKKRKFQRQQRAGLESFVPPFPAGRRDAEGGSMKDNTIPVFTPMPSPKPRMNDKSLDRKTMNSFFVHDQTKPSLPGTFGSRIKSMVFGRAKTDEERSKEESESWFARFWKKKEQETEEADSWDGHGIVKEKSRPDLQISVDRAAERQDARLSSAWSISPTPEPRFMPWAKKISSPKKRASDLSVPVSVGSYSEGSSILVPKPYKSSQFAPPLHHGFSRPESTQRPVTPPPMESPALPSRGLTPPRDGHGRSASSGSLSRMLTTPHAHARQSSQNPFATPFDDHNGQ